MLLSKISYPKVATAPRCLASSNSTVSTLQFWQSWNTVTNMQTSLCVQVAFSGVRPGAKHPRKQKTQAAQVTSPLLKYKIQISEMHWKYQNGGWVLKKHHRITLPSLRCSAQQRDTVSKEAAGREQKRIRNETSKAIQNMLCFEPSASLARMLTDAFPPGSRFLYGPLHGVSLPLNMKPDKTKNDKK